jgi:replicative superfamily II helicase
MVDFKKRLKAASGKQPVVPREIYDRLDRASDKGPLRPAQEAVLGLWHEKWRDRRDAIVKLHTGQGKTLIGLVLLQSKLNEGAGPALYLCPDHFLVDQTAVQAKQFGIEYCTALGNADLPDKFLNSKAILICTVQKLFNGLTKFGLNHRSMRSGPS